MTDPNHYCPICGARFTDERHRCRQKVLDSIDGARSRHDDINTLEKAKPFWQRLADGFKYSDPDTCEGT